MTYLIVCRTCGNRAAVEMAINQKELADVGMLERRCFHCGTDTRWGLQQDYRRSDRRRADRRKGERRGKARGTADRRKGPIRASERRIS